MTIHFTADVHLFHLKLANKRGYDTCEDMHLDIKKKWNRKVKPNDSVYILGDLSFGRVDPTIEVLDGFNGHLHLIVGNHDEDKMIRSLLLTGIIESVEHYKLFIFIRDAKLKQHIALSHFPFMTWDRASHGSWHLHGHSHGSLQAPETTRMDVGMDTNNCEVYSMPEIVDIMSQRTYNICDLHGIKK